jgi:serine/threonine-protein kinase
MDAERLAEIDAVLESALGLAAAARPAFLDRRCAGDPELRREVESLLALSAREVDGLVSRVRELAASLSGVPGSGEPHDPLPPGSTLGAYRILRRLGRGGMGVVALAERSDGTFERRVAVKLLLHADSSPEAIRRFELERQILARLSHPHIAHLVDGGVDPRGLPYLVMEYVEGVPVDEHCDRHQLGIEARLRLVVAIARAVHAAHRNLVVHRDIKPANLLVTAEGVPKLLDFGIAKLVAGESADLSLIQSAAKVLTPTYASPEQVRGDPIGTASDVYQLGLLLYELLTGRRPQGSSTRSLAELVLMVCETEPPPPSDVVRLDVPGEPGAAELARRRGSTPARLARRYRAELDAIVARALRKDPDRRYGLAEELAADLERHLESRPVRARRATLAYRARKLVQRNLAASLVAALAAVSTLGYAVAVTLQARAIELERRRAEAESEKAREVERLVLDLFEIADPAASRGGTVTAAELLDRGVERVESELAGQPEVQARMLSALGLVQGRLGLLDEGVALQRRALELRRRLYGDDHLDVAESASRLGFLLREKGDHAAAEPLLAEAVALQRRLRPDSIELSDSLTHLGLLRYFDGDWDEAETILAESLALRRAHGDDAAVARGLSNLGLVTRSRGRPEEALRYFREAIRLNRQARPSRDGALVNNLLGMGRTLHDMGDYEAAQSAFEEMLAVQRSLSPPDHPDLAFSMTLAATNLVRLGELGRAEALFTESLDILQAKLEPGHTRIVTTMQGLGELRLAQGRLDEAEAVLRDALAMRRSLVGQTHPLVAAGLLPLGRCLAAQGRLPEARSAWEEALAMAEGVGQARLAARLRSELARVGPRDPS